MIVDGGCSYDDLVDMNSGGDGSLAGTIIINRQRTLVRASTRFVGSVGFDAKMITVCYSRSCIEGSSNLGTVPAAQVAPYFPS